MSEVTVIGSNTVVNGNLEGDEDLTIEGRVEGTINLSRTLTIEINGVVHANINVRNAIISGVLVGNVEAEDSVHITEEGRVVGVNVIKVTRRGQPATDRGFGLAIPIGIALETFSQIP